MVNNIMTDRQFLELAYRLCDSLETTEINLLYEGSVTQEVMKEFTSMTENNLISHAERPPVQRKVFYVMVETLQNITRHAERLPGDEEEVRRGFVVISHSDEAYYVVTGNVISEGTVPKLKEKLDLVNSLDHDGLSVLYKKQIQEGTISERGGAGLGFIDIAKKSGNKIGYDFVDLPNLPGCKFFINIVKVTR